MSAASGGDPIRIGLNGFGRIGRSVFRAALGYDAVEIVAINDIMDDDDMRYLLTYDTVMGQLQDVSVADGTLVVGDQDVELLNERDPRQLPWDRLDVDVALECTGIFRTAEDAHQHIEAGADKTVISAPPKGEEPVVQLVYGVNQDTYDGEEIVSNASCTTNSVAPVAKVLHEHFGIRHGLLTTVHAYTSTQSIVDGPLAKRRRGRAAAENIIPTTTGAAIATTEVLPELSGRLDGMAMRVPVPNGSITDFVVNLEEDVGAEAVNDALRTAAHGDLDGVLGYTDEEIVSSDVLGLPYSSYVDLQSTMSTGEGFVKVLAWYDNEIGFSHRLLELSQYITTGHAEQPNPAAMATVAGLTPPDR